MFLFPAYFQSGYPIYSAKSVRFRMGHCKSAVDEGSDLSADEMFIWTYTSPEFPMAQVSLLVAFFLSTFAEEIVFLVWLYLFLSQLLDLRGREETAC